MAPSNEQAPESKTDVISTDAQATSDHASEGSNSREAFLSSFTQADNKRIMRKVDRRFLLIIGMMYLIKNVR